MARYAERTDVSSDKSRAEIERTLRRYGADQFMYGWDQNKAMVAFTMTGRQIRFVLPMPDRGSPEFTHTPARKTRRTESQIESAYEQAVRQRWRALALAIKAKLESVEAGIATFEDEFMAYVVLPNGQTMGEWAQPQIEQAYAGGGMPKLLSMGEA